MKLGGGAPVKREMVVIGVLIAVLVALSFKEGRRCERAALSAPVCTTAPTPAVPSTNEWQKCLDARHAEQLDYIKWRGKHVQQLEACTAALGEATHALVHRRTP